MYNKALKSVDKLKSYNLLYTVLLLA